MYDLPAPDQPYLRVDHADPQHARTVLVDWMLGNSCCFACSYCPSSLHDGSIRWQSEEAVLALFDRIRSHYVDLFGRKVWIQFTGGEPTMHPAIVPLLEAAARHGFAVSMISNGNRTLRFWQKIRPHLNAMILTYHDEFVEHDRFLEVARLLVEAMPVHCNVTMHPDRFDAVYAKAEALAEALPEATFSLKPLREGFGANLYPYTPEQMKRLDRILTHPRRDLVTMPRGVMRVTERDGSERNIRACTFILQGTNRWRGYSCQAGLESLRVKGSGEIFRAVCGVGGMIGRIGGEVRLPATPVLCTREHCSCTADILISKVAAAP